ncbi:hypothetical protein NDN08_008069 [Rhodosorus marinus]|uniref:Mitochondrial cardiolipin hydrolase n=1 Tax=Rhodosorus marinus TaxID=101924 RepID=A0AAV8V2X7_9RHOD|nr:hypothetical protein NDN08_008069 [Rhodosorus marinus]
MADFESFFGTAGPLEVTVHGSNTSLDWKSIARAKQFKTGSFGWYGSGRTSCSWDGVESDVVLSLSVTVLGSKKNTDELESKEASSKARTQTLDLELFQGLSSADSTDFDLSTKTPAYREQNCGPDHTQAQSQELKVRPHAENPQPQGNDGNSRPAPGVPIGHGTKPAPGAKKNQTQSEQVNRNPPDAWGNTGFSTSHAQIQSFQAGRTIKKQGPSPGSSAESKPVGRGIVPNGVWDDRGVSDNFAHVDSYFKSKLVITEPYVKQHFNEVLFFPDKSGNNVKKVLYYISSSKNTLDVCVYAFTDDRFKDALLDLHKRGVRIRVLSDETMSKVKGADAHELFVNGIQVRLGGASSYTSMHHKFAVVDDTILLSGSFNWTVQGSKKNYENVIITSDPRLIKTFSCEFGRLWGSIDKIPSATDKQPPEKPDGKP